MYLIDTNVWLELLLEQEKADDVRQLLQTAEPSRLYITEFAAYSIGIVLLRLKKAELFVDFVQDTLLDAGVGLLRLAPVDMRALVQSAGSFNLDFDDAYQYAVAERHDLAIISFDADFDRTDRGRQSPAEIRA